MGSRDAFDPLPISLLPDASDEVRKQYAGASHETLLRAITGARQVNRDLQRLVNSLELVNRTIQQAVSSDSPDAIAPGQSHPAETTLLVQQARVIEVLLDLTERLAQPTEITGGSHERDQF